MSLYIQFRIEKFLYLILPWYVAGNNICSHSMQTFLAVFTCWLLVISQAASLRYDVHCKD